MNARILRIELRRSTAPWAGIVTLAIALAVLYGLQGQNPQLTNSLTGWTGQWVPMARWMRYLLVYLWPIVVGIGALQGLRDHRSGMAELLSTTCGRPGSGSPRPRLRSPRR